MSRHYILVAEISEGDVKQQPTINLNSFELRCLAHEDPGWKNMSTVFRCASKEDTKMGVSLLRLLLSGFEGLRQKDPTA